MAKIKNEEYTQESCMQRIMAVKDALEVLHGRWKLPIIITLSFGAKRFKEISKEVKGITDKMLSKELKDMEMNQLVKQTVYDSFPPTVEYMITDHGRTLKEVVDVLAKWGVEHRKKMIRKSK